MWFNFPQSEFKLSGGWKAKLPLKFDGRHLGNIASEPWDTAIEFSEDTKVTIDWSSVRKWLLYMIVFQDPLDPSQGYSRIGFAEYPLVIPQGISGGENKHLGLSIHPWIGQPWTFECPIVHSLRLNFNLKDVFFLSRIIMTFYVDHLNKLKDFE